VINTHYTPEYIDSVCAGCGPAGAVGLAWMRRNWRTTNGFTTGWGSWGWTVFRRKARPERSNAIAPDIAAPLIAAVVKSTGIVKMETIQPMIANQKAFELALHELHILPLNPVAA